MLFLSQVIGKRVLDRHGDAYGKVHDLIVALGERYPPVTGLVVQVPGRRTIFLPWSDVESLETDGARLRTSSIDITGFRQRPNEIRLWLDLMDKQIVDVGLAGILRRLGLSGPGERLARALKMPIENYIEWEDVDPVESSVSSLKLRKPHGALATLHPAEVAHIVEQLAPRDRAGILEALEDEVAADVIEELSAEDQVDVLEALAPEKAADILEEMGPDEAADLVGDLPRDRQRELLDLMEAEEAEDVRELLAYNEGTAGGLMTTDYVAIGEETTASEALDLIRGLDPEMEQATFYLYVTDAERRLVGVVNLRELIAARPDQAVREFMKREPISVGVDMDEDEVAVTIARYNLVALPVVDGEGRLQGIVTVDDALELVLGERWRRRLPHVFEAAEER